ncbi:DUF4238 domain-containing protein [Sphingomonas gei]|uniref:DUF4238 domain-containing protein n=1 Tax=Sphingomonas gei TaxID=1395960 RepID=A0A4S1XGR9_9SPHN|nr:DUF4238 domain-containing protein [Sphingomonas gei]TGX55819.1 DUF4238 domain-containing protein [Sphingomonas gei]
MDTMLPPVPKNQHYVWRYYLEAWAVDDLLACYRQRDRKPIRTNPKNIASQTYFYRVPALSEAELNYLELVIANRPDEGARQVHRNFVKLFQMPAKVRQIVERHGRPDVRAASEALLDHADRSLGERYQVGIENKGLPLLERLKARDAAFWKDGSGIDDFLFFIANQYLRTARMQNLIARITAPPGVDLGKVWSIERHIWATEIGAALLRERERYRAVILVNRTRIPFITGDQPVINLNPSRARDVKLYYPVRPDTALLLTTDDYAPDGAKEISAFDAERYNYEMYRWSDDQIYGLDTAYLAEVCALDKMPLP